ERHQAVVRTLARDLVRDLLRQPDDHRGRARRVDVVGDRRVRLHRRHLGLARRATCGRRPQSEHDAVQLVSCSRRAQPCETAASLGCFGHPAPTLSKRRAYIPTVRLLYCGSGWLPIVDQIAARLASGDSITRWDRQAPLADVVADIDVLLPSNATITADAIAAAPKLRLIQ